MKLEAGCKNETTTETDDSVARLEAGYNEEARIQQGGGGGTGKMWVGFDSCWCCCWYGCACCCKASAGHHKRLTPEMVNRKLYCCMQAERLSKVCHMKGRRSGREGGREGGNCVWPWLMRAYDIRPSQVLISSGHSTFETAGSGSQDRREEGS